MAGRAVRRWAQSGAAPSSTPQRVQRAVVSSGGGCATRRWMRARRGGRLQWGGTAPAPATSHQPPAISTGHLPSKPSMHQQADARACSGPPDRCNRPRLQLRVPASGASTRARRSTAPRSRRRQLGRHAAPGLGSPPALGAQAQPPTPLSTRAVLSLCPAAAPADPRGQCPLVSDVDPVQSPLPLPAAHSGRVGPAQARSAASCSAPPVVSATGAASPPPLTDRSESPVHTPPNTATHLRPPLTTTTFPPLLHPPRLLHLARDWLVALRLFAFSALSSIRLVLLCTSHTSAATTQYSARPRICSLVRVSRRSALAPSC